MPPQETLVEFVNKRPPGKRFQIPTSELWKIDEKRGCTHMQILKAMHVGGFISQFPDLDLRAATSITLERTNKPWNETDLDVALSVSKLD